MLHTAYVTPRSVRN